MRGFKCCEKFYGKPLKSHRRCVSEERYAGRKQSLATLLDEGYAKYQRKYGLHLRHARNSEGVFFFFNF